jgi:hypothetical protein
MTPFFSYLWGISIFFFFFYQVWADVPPDSSLFVLTNRDINNTSVLSLGSIVGSANESVIVRDVSMSRIFRNDIWYLKNYQIWNSGNPKVISSGDGAPELDAAGIPISSGNGALEMDAGTRYSWVFKPNSDGSYELIVGGNMFLGVDTNQVAPRMYPTSAGEQGAYGAWSFLLVPTTVTTMTVQTISTVSMSAQSIPVGGAPRTIIQTHTLTMTTTLVRGFRVLLCLVVISLTLDIVR